ncbi:LysR substrate-binding domain-containing protein [Thalassomonas sp. M1454]|uniref:LysR substrate-binding domain-containing protein n=1 Tax=Thalassomonas sp. M1454 TaxID=2594477 RepID=UPI00117EB465|nr:LysR substrate-binding domain-containing protein [Thalassomonas sp. M1454]TRX56463.1 LysR family transcriptional regulator [Thalassomonas sp. M1454]
MTRRLPPLHLFTIFEASARHQSFKLASEELFITPSAVSHQIKSLEEYLGFELFTRKSRGLSLNSAGKVYLGYVQKSLELLESGTKAVKNQYNAPTLKISTFPSMTANVIIPQLSLFQQAHQDIDIRIETGMNVIDLRYDDVDLAIRIGDGKWPDVQAKKLLDINIAAVCSPDFAKKHQLTKVSQINEVPLIDLTNMEHIWQTWAKSFGIDNLNPEHKLSFSHYDAALQAAEQGLGLALAMMPIEQSLIERNLLCNPFNKTLPYRSSLYAVYRKEDEKRHDISCFLDWLLKSRNLQVN